MMMLSMCTQLADNASITVSLKSVNFYHGHIYIHSEDTHVTFVS